MTKIRLVGLKEIDINTQNQIIELINQCNKEDKTHGSAKLDNSVPYYEDMKSYFLYYDEDTLISFIKLFGIFDHSIELYGYTLPVYRGKGCFKSVLEEAIKEVKAYGYSNIVYGIDTNSIKGLEWTTVKHLMYQSTEVTMKLINGSSIKKLDDALFIKKAEMIELPLLIALHEEIFKLEKEIAQKYLQNVMNFAYKEFYFLYSKNHLIGLGGIYYENDSASIFGVGIREQFRGQGYSKSLISGLIEIIHAEEICDIVLEVDQDNHIAYQLYKNLGFIELYSMSYYKEEVKK